jgi:hypothetical protein
LGTIYCFNKKENVWSKFSKNIPLFQFKNSSPDKSKIIKQISTYSKRFNVEKENIIIVQYLNENGNFLLKQEIEENKLHTNHFL